MRNKNLFKRVKEAKASADSDEKPTLKSFENDFDKFDAIC
jgi:hypothetical protein